MKSKLLLALLALALYSGCSSAGVKVDPRAVGEIKKGITTRAQVLALMGPTSSDTLLGDGREMMTWMHVHVTMKGATFIPVYGLFRGGTETATTSCQVILNKDKIVEDVLLSQGQMDARMGG